MPPAFELPADKREAICREFGTSGRHWVAGFDQLLQTCVERWQLTVVDAASAGLPINVILFAERAEGTPVVLKIAHPHPEQRTEMLALQHYAGRGAVRIVDVDMALGALLMERVQPGNCLRDAVAAAVRSALHVEVIDSLPQPCRQLDGLPHFADWLRTAFATFRLRNTRDHPLAPHVARAQALWVGLRRVYGQDWLLHGDLHHENILQDARGGWLAIDPKGVIGPKVMECGRYLHNFMQDELAVETVGDASLEALTDLYATRFAAMSATLDEPPAAVAAANYIDAVLATTWTVNSATEPANLRDSLQLVNAAALMCKRLPLAGA